MKNIFNLILIILIVSKYSEAQNLVAVHHNGQPSFYTQVTDAVSNAQNGDTIYIPGGSYPIGELEIKKELHLFGVGHNPDSSKATSYTLLTGDIFLLNGASKTEIVGIKLSSGQYGGMIFLGSPFYTDSTKLNNCQIRKCNLSQIAFENDFGLTGRFSNNVISENIIGAITNNSGPVSGNDGNIISNNVISGGVANIGGSNVISNNIFLLTTNPISGAIQSVIQSNIFLVSCCYTDGSSNQSNLISNNLFVTTINIFSSATNTVQNNYYSQGSSSIFVNLIGTSFSYSSNYDLISTSIGNNAGADGTDIGIYGGLYPWKEGSIPTNPHIQSKTISSNTDASGNLPLSIKVVAQDY